MNSVPVSSFLFTRRGFFSLFLTAIASILLPLNSRATQQMPAAPLRGEYIILTGGVSLNMWEKYKAQPHDNWWLNFIRASRIRIEELRAQYGPGAHLTWLVYRQAYERRGVQENQDLFPTINSIPAAYGVKIVYYSSASEVIDYLNNRSEKIAGLEYFGHSNKACFLFDYSNEIDSASKVWLHENDFRKLRGGLFTTDAYVRSWGCHSGESMSLKFRAATGVKMVGAFGKTQYMTETLPIISTPGGKWSDQ